MDALNDDRGQALIVAVLLLGIAAVAIGGLRLAQDRIVAGARERRAGEAAVEAATAVVADTYAVEMRLASASTRSPLDVRAALTAAQVRDDARAAADSLSLQNGGGPVTEPVVTCANGLVNVALSIAERLYRAGFTAPLCSLR